MKAGFALIPSSFFFSLCLFFGEGVSLWVNSDKCVNKNVYSLCFLVRYRVSSVSQGFLDLHRGLYPGHLIIFLLYNQLRHILHRAPISSHVTTSASLESWQCCGVSVSTPLSA